jgi:alpha-mannosidase
MRCVGNGVCGAPEQLEGQMIGKQTFKYAIAPHAGTWLDAKIWQQGWSHNSSMKAIRTEIHEGTLPLSKSFVEINNPAVLLSAMKKAEKSDDLILRAFNIGESKVSCVVAIDELRTGVQTNMNEETISQVEVKEGKIALDIKSKQVVTLAVDVQYNNE